MTDKSERRRHDSGHAVNSPRSIKEYACEEHRRDSEPTRVRLAIEVPFAELEPSLKKAYRELAQQVQIPASAVARCRPR